MIPVLTVCVFVFFPFILDIGQGNFHFPCSADHDEQDWQPYPVDPYSCYMCGHTMSYTYTYCCSRLVTYVCMYIMLMVITYYNTPE